MKVFLTAFGLHNPFASAELQQHNPIPIAIDAEDGMDLDYSSLMVAEGFVMDRGSFEYIAERRKTFLAPMYHSLQVLQAEGLLEVADFAEPCNKYREQVEQRTNKLVEHVDPWLDVARAQWAQLRPELLDFQRRYGTLGRELIDTSHYGVISYLQRRDGKIDPREACRLHTLLQSGRHRLKVAEEQDIQEVLKPLVAQVLINDLVREWLKTPFIDWDDAQGFYHRLHLGQWTEFDDVSFPSAAVACQARLLFSVVIPELRPSRVEDVVSFLRNRSAVRSLREEMQTVLRDPGSVSSEWMVRLQSEAIKAELSLANRSRVVKWVGRAASLIPGGGWAAELIAAATEELVEGVSSQKARKRFEWYYALQRLKME